MQQTNKRATNFLLQTCIKNALLCLIRYLQSVSTSLSPRIMIHEYHVQRREWTCTASKGPALFFPLRFHRPGYWLHVSCMYVHVSCARNLATLTIPGSICIVLVSLCNATHPDTPCLCPSSLHLTLLSLGLLCMSVWGWSVRYSVSSIAINSTSTHGPRIPSPQPASPCSRPWRLLAFCDRWSIMTKMSQAKCTTKA